MGGRRLYSAGPPESLRLCPLDGLVLAYHRPSGITHLLDSPLPEILGVLGPEPSSAEAVLDRLAQDYVIEDGERLLDHVADHLNALAGLGIVHITQ